MTKHIMDYPDVANTNEVNNYIIITPAQGAINLFIKCTQTIVENRTVCNN
jgi:hypothetical protein